MFGMIKIKTKNAVPDVLLKSRYRHTGSGSGPSGNAGMTGEKDSGIRREKDTGIRREKDSGIRREKDSGMTSGEMSK